MAADVGFFWQPLVSFLATVRQRTSTYVDCTYVVVRRRTLTFVDVRLRTSTYDDVRRRTATYDDVRRRTTTYVDVRREKIAISRKVRKQKSHKQTSKQFAENQQKRRFWSSYAKPHVSASNSSRKATHIDSSSSHYD